MIDSFTDENHFLSNFHETPFVFHGWTIPTAEHMFQALKSADPVQQQWVLEAETPKIAKSRGRQVPLRPDWEAKKIGTMRGVLTLKFPADIHNEFSRMLRATDPHMLVEGNNWGDTFWGYDESQGGGQNWLGHLLMGRRAELMDNLATDPSN